jgi:hypothetical protein
VQSDRLSGMMQPQQLSANISNNHQNNFNRPRPFEIEAGGSLMFGGGGTDLLNEFLNNDAGNQFE